MDLRRLDIYIRPGPGTFLSTNLTDKQKTKDPYTLILKKKVVQGHHGSSWVNFKPCLSIFGAIVWIWEGSVNPPGPFQRTIFDEL